MLNIHFTVDYSDSANPSLALRSGHADWNVRSENPDLSPGNIGTLSIDPTLPSSEDFEVKIANAASAGAASVGTINLKSASFLWSGYSSIETGSRIIALGDSLTVVKDSAGNGGEVSLLVEQDVSGTMTMPVLKFLSILGDLEGDLTVGDRIDCGGRLIVVGAVHASASISIADICANSNAFLEFDSDSSGDEFAGDLFLGNGVTDDSTVTIKGPISLGATIDLNSVGVRGTLACLNDSSATIINGGGVVVGFVTLAAGNGNAFSGTAEFEWLSVGFITTDDGADLDGQVSVTGDMVLFPSTIRIKGDLTSNGSISVAGTTNEGFIVVEGNVTGGDINLADMRGSQLAVWGSVTSAASLIQIGNMANGGPGTPSVVTVLNDFAGTLELGTGIKLGQSAKIQGEFLTGATIDLSDQNVAGLLEITGGGGGDILNGGTISGNVILADGSANTYSGSANFASVSAGGHIRTQDQADLSGVLNISGIVSSSGIVTVAGDVSSGGKIWVVGNCAGAVNVDNDLIGDVQIDSNLTLSSTVTVGGALAGAGLGGGGRILVSGICDGDIAIAEQTADLTLIHLLGGLGLNGSVRINTAGGIWDARGDIHVGPSPPPFPLNDITFDGCIRIHSDGETPAGGGDLKGAITIVGCHNIGDLNLCLDGGDGGENIEIKQSGNCTNQVDWSCGTCP